MISASQIDHKGLTLSRRVYLTNFEHKIPKINLFDVTFHVPNYFGTPLDFGNPIIRRLINFLATKQCRLGFPMFWQWTRKVVY